MSELSNEEIKVVQECLKAAAYGPFFIDKDSKFGPFWEIHSIFGPTMEELRAIADNFPNVDMNAEDVKLAINNSFNNLLGYPHGCSEETWSKYISVTKKELYRLFAKYRNDKSQNYFEGMM
jgi:hypothetical protein